MPCGGVYGYGNLLDIVRNPKNREHESMMIWLGGKYDPDEFDLLSINKMLKKYGSKASVGKKSR